MNRQLGTTSPSTPGAGPEQATVRIGSTLAIPGVLRNLGVAPDKVLSSAGIDPKVFEDPGNRISFAARGRLLARCVEATGCQHFGLLVGEHGNLHGFGLVGLLASYCPDVGSALHTLVRFLPLHVTGATASIQVYGEQAILSYAVHENAEAIEQIGDGAVATMFNIVHGLCGPDWQAAEILFAHRKPRNVEPHRKFFRARLRYDAEQYAVSFHSSWLSHALPEADPELRRLLQAQVDALEARHGNDFAAQVRVVLRAAILTGHASEEEVAAIFSIHLRTLSRRLKSLGTSFQQLNDECSFEIAKQMLELTDQDMAQIASALGYADSSALTRAFRRWSGTTPANWRATRGGEPKVP